MVTTAWVGFDNNEPIGRIEYGGTAALPIWIDYMEVALNGRAEIHHPTPSGLVNARIDPDTGQLARPGQSNAIFELFRQEQTPQAPSLGSPGRDIPRDTADIIQDLF